MVRGISLPFTSDLIIFYVNLLKWQRLKGCLCPCGIYDFIFKVCVSTATRDTLAGHNFSPWPSALPLRRGFRLACGLWLICVADPTFPTTFTLNFTSKFSKGIQKGRFLGICQVSTFSIIFLTFPKLLVMFLFSYGSLSHLSLDVAGIILYRLISWTLSFK